MKAIQKERLDKILELLKNSSYLKYIDLERELNVSAITIRRDVDKMESLGLVNKILGGVEIKRANQDIDYDIRSRRNLSSKKSIAKKVSKLIPNDALIFLDSGTTVFELIPYLKNKNVKVVTNCFKHINSLLENEIDFIILGGKVKKLTKASVGVITILEMNKYNFDLCILGANGVDKEKGFSTPDVDEATIKEIAIRQSKKTYILADDSKFNKVYSISFEKFNEKEWIR